MISILNIINFNNFLKTSAIQSVEPKPKIDINQFVSWFVHDYIVLWLNLVEPKLNKVVPTTTSSIDYFMIEPIELIKPWLKSGVHFFVWGSGVSLLWNFCLKKNHGSFLQVENVVHSGPKKMVWYFTGATNILYTFGGHAVTV